MSEEEHRRPRRDPRWAPRQKAMHYGGDIGATRMNELMQTGKICAKKDGKKVVVDLNSIDDYLWSLPDVGSIT